jgi:two-component system phosphate regulon sensor histidine kinase PhoR
MEGISSDNYERGGAVLHAPFFVTAAHELKSPLALMRQLALDIETGELSPEETAKLAYQVRLTSERALRLTTNLTKHARLEDSLFDLEPLNPVALCDEIVEELTPLYRAKGRMLEVRGRRRAALGLANKDLLRRILLSFADNALHYGSAEAPVTMSVHITRGGEFIRLGVRDYGPAVPTKLWQQLTSTIGTARQPLHARPESSGLGMYIAGKFAEAMQAKLGATRHRDGATFYIDIHASRQLRLL